MEISSHKYLPKNFYYSKRHLGLLGVKKFKIKKINRGLEEEQSIKTYIIEW